MYSTRIAPSAFLHTIAENAAAFHIELTWSVDTLLNDILFAISPYILYDFFFVYESMSIARMCAPLFPHHHRCDWPKETLPMRCMALLSCHQHIHTNEHKQLSWMRPFKSETRVIEAYFTLRHFRGIHSCIVVHMRIYIHRPHVDFKCTSKRDATFMNSIRKQ